MPLDPPSGRLLAALKTGAGGALDDLMDDGLVEAALARLVATGAAAHPSLVVPADQFVAHVGALLRPSRDPKIVAAAIDGLRADDLHLAFACLIGAPRAAEVLQREQLGQLGRHLARLRPSEAFVDEVRQALLVRILVPSAGRRPRIAEYRGVGRLGAWLRVAAGRLALDLEWSHANAALPAGSPAGAEDPPDLEMEYLKRRYTREFRAALREALAALPREQREVLRLNFVHGLNIQAIGQRLNIHRATVARWISSARQAVFAETRRLLSERLKLAPSEFDSLLRMVRSQLDQSMAGLLGSQEAEPR